MKLSDKLVDSIADIWKRWSVQCMALSGSIMGGWATLPDEYKSELWLQKGVHYTVLLLLVVGIIGAHFKQKNLEPPPADKVDPQ
jgi:hypothetical protein